MSDNELRVFTGHGYYVGDELGMSDSCGRTQRVKILKVDATTITIERIPRWRRAIGWPARLYRRLRMWWWIRTSTP